MPTGRGDLASATVNGKIYTIGGHTGVLSTVGNPLSSSTAENHLGR